MLVKIKNLIKPLIFTFLLFNVSFISAQNGTIKGRITDKSNNEPLIGASALILETSTGGASDLDGNYIINNVKPGKYTIKTSYISYKPIQQVIVVEANKETVLDIQLVSADVNLKEVEVVAKANRESENVLLLEQKNSLVATQAVGAKEMSRKGISNAEAAVGQVSGISKQEGVKNVFVRGLGDRYNATTLNGFPIPSEDPEYKNISLDFFGSDIIKNIEVNKVISTNNYMDVAGAAINISTKELIGNKELSIDLSGGVNSRTLGADFLKSNGVNYLGIANSTQPGSNFKTSYNYENSLNLQSANLPVNYSYGFTTGKKFKIGENRNPLSVLLVADYSQKHAFTSEQSTQIITNGTVSENLEGLKSSININQTVLGNINYLIGNKSELNYNFLMIHDNNQYVGKYVGLIEAGDTYNGALIRQQTNDNLLITNQLSSKTNLSQKIKLDLGIAYNRVKGAEPDRRVNRLKEITTSEYKPFISESAFVRNFSELIENDFNGKAEFSYLLPAKFAQDISSLHLGYNGRYVTDNFEANEYSYNSHFSDTQSLDNLLLDNWYNQANLAADKFTGAYRRNSTYTVTKFINSAYVSADYQFSKKLIANIGLNFDIVNFDIKYDINDGQENSQNQLNKNYILPSFNLKYNPDNKNILRFGFSKTYTLPQSKEISPYLYIDLTSSRVGNPDLQPSDNYNTDLKWDFYLSPVELISITGFYKYIKNPISSTYQGSAGGYYTYANISNYATVAGAELEIKKNIFNFSNSQLSKTNKLTARLNSSYIYSNMTVLDVTTNNEKQSRLEGAAPLLFNADLSYIYSHNAQSFTNSVVLSYFSNRIYSIGMSGFQDVIEKGVPTLDFISIVQLNNHIDFKLKAKNILDPRRELTRKDDNGDNHILGSYYKGIDLSLGITYKF